MDNIFLRICISAKTVFGTNGTDNVEFSIAFLVAILYPSPRAFGDLNGVGVFELIFDTLNNRLNRGSFGLGFGRRLGCFGSVVVATATLGDGVATGGTSLVGQSLGAKRKDLAYAHAQVAYKIGIVVSLGLMLVIFIFARHIAQLFTTDPVIIYGVTISLYVVIFSMIPQNGRVILSGALRGAGDVKFVAYCALISVAILRPILTYLFCYPIAGMFPGSSIAVIAPWVAFLLDAVVRDRLMMRRLRQAKWLDIKLS